MPPGARGMAPGARWPTLMLVAQPQLSNAAIADALEELGDLYELDGAIVHRVLAYRAAAKTVREAPVSVAELARAGRATELPAIGDTLQEKIVALVDTGTIPAAERLRAKFPPGLIAITRLPGIGPKRARLLHSELGIDSLEELRRGGAAAATAHRARARPEARGPACCRRSPMAPVSAQLRACCCPRRSRPGKRSSRV